MSKPTDSQVLEHIPVVQVNSGEKFVNTKGIHAIKDGIKRSQQSSELLKKPDWLRMRIQSSPKFDAVRTIVHEHRLATVCVRQNARI